MTLIITIVSIIVFFFINNYIKKFVLFLNFKGQKHQKFSGMRNIPLSGGIFLTFSILLLNLENNILSYFVLLVFFLGFVSDTNFLSSPKLRFLIQFLLIISFVLFLDVKIAKTNLFFLDILLNNIYFQYFFSVFCLLVLINGSNFIDGLNGLMLGYFSIILALIFNLEYYLLLQISKLFFINLFLVLIFLFVMNIKNKLFMGDSGSYVLALISGYFLIEIYSINSKFSPFFIVLLLWYPCFENLFSILRKLIQNKSPTGPDDNHLHQLIYYYINKKKILGIFNSNNISSFLVLFYNLIVFTIAATDPHNTKFQILLIIFNISIYSIMYFKLFHFRNSNNLN